MPYLKIEQRIKISDDSRNIKEPGDLNFAICCMVNSFLKNNGKNYKSINAAVGAIECAKLEIYRRLAAPYEDDKIDENGDINLFR